MPLDVIHHLLAVYEDPQVGRLEKGTDEIAIGAHRAAPRGSEGDYIIG